MDNLRSEIEESEERYNRLDVQEQQLKTNHTTLLSLRNTRRNVSEWTYEERQFVNEMSSKSR